MAWYHKPSGEDKDFCEFFMSGESPSTLRLCVSLCYLLDEQEERTTHRRKGQGGPWRSPREEPVLRIGSYLQDLQCFLYVQSLAHWQGCRILFHHFCPSFSYVEDWQAFPVESQTVNIRLCEPFGLCHNSPAGPLLHESSQTHKQMADGCVPTKLNLSTLNCTFHDTLRCYRIFFHFFSL